MSHRISWMTVICLIAFSPARGVAAPLTAEDVVLRGRHPSATFRVQLAGEPLASLALRITASAVVSGEASTVTVSVDDVPVASALVAEIRRLGVLDVRLPHLPPGDHLVRVQATLEVEGDPCLERSYDGAFLRISRASELISTAPSSMRVRAELGVRDAILGTRGRAVGLVVEAPYDARMSLALLSLATALRAHASPVTDAPSRGRVILRVAGWPSTREGASSDDSALGASLRGIVATSSDDIVLLARDTNSMVTLARTFTSDTFANLCGDERTCAVPIDFAIAHPPPQVRNHGVIVRAIGDIGFRTGYVARDLGEHRVRLVFRKPPTWRIGRHVTLRLPVVLPSSAASRNFDAHVHITMNEQPLDSFVLDGNWSTERELVVAIPSSMLDAETWVVDILIKLRARDDTACARLDQDAIWLRLSPTGGIEVDRSELATPGIAAFMRDVEDHGLILDGSMVFRSVRELLACLPWLGPLLDAAAFRISVGGGSARIPVLERLRPGTNRGVELVRHDGGSWLHLLGTERRDIPMLDAATHTMLSVRASSEGVRRLSAWSGSQSVDEPAFADLLTDTAVFDGRAWVSLGTMAVTRVERTVARESASRVSRVRSERSRARLTVNVVWACIALAGVLLAGVVAIRRRRAVRVAPDGLEELAEDEAK